MKEDFTQEERDIKFKQLYDKYYWLMYFVAKRFLHAKEDIEDAIQETYLRVSVNMDKIGEVDCKETRNFLCIICRNISITIFQKRNKQTTEPLTEMVPDYTYHTDPQRVSIDNQVAEIVEECILNMPEKYRECLYLNVVLEYDTRVISELLQVKYETIRKRLQRGRKMLQKRLEERGIAYDDK